MPFIIILIVGVAIVIAAPLALIWAINTLFGLAIAYTLSTWFAALILGGVFSRGEFFKLTITKE